MSFPYPKRTIYGIGNLFTSKEAIKAFNTNIRENRTEEKIQHRREDEFLNATQIPKVYLETLNLRAINKLLGQDFYQYNVMEGVLIASEELLVGKSLMETSKKVHQNIGKLVELASGANGTVSSASIGDKSDLFKIIIKTAIDPLYDDLMHEAFIGLAGTNQLRKEIPNFSFIYGVFKCDGPIMPGKGKEVKQFCTGKTNSVVTYALYENIVGKTFSDEVKNMSGTDFLNIYLQVLLALNYGNLKCDFTHFDLHGENVILRKLEKNETFGIKYPTQDFRRYLCIYKYNTYSHRLWLFSY